jgi:fatty acid desaturase
MGFIGHDAGHRQIAQRTRHNDLIGFLTGNLILGMSFDWWVDKHNQHHSHPNELDTDPDISIPFLAFSDIDAAGKQGVMRALVRYQAFLFFPLLCLEAFALQAQGLQFLFYRRARHALTESSLLLLHFLWYFGVLFFFLPAWQALLFIAIQQGLTGLLLGLAFAPNHKGMPILDPRTPMDFLHRQVITARNVRGHPLVDFWYGGLNYQIEHHLFPTIPRNQLKHAQPIIRQFCQERAIPYCETSMAQSYREIVQFLHTVGQTPAGTKMPACSSISESTEVGK